MFFTAFFVILQVRVFIKGMPPPPPVILPSKYGANYKKKMGGRYITPLETLHFDKNWQIGSYNSGGCLPCGGVEQQRRSRVASHIFFLKKDKKKISDNNNNKDASIVMMWNLHAMRQTPPMGESSCCTAVSESPLIGLSGREKTPKLDPAQQGKKEGNIYKTDGS